MNKSINYSGKEELAHHEVSFGSFLENTYQLVKTYIEGKTIADIGCGTGVYAEKFQQDGFAVSCFELDTELSNIAKSRGLFVIQGDVQMQKFQNEFKQKFDSVYTLDVLEHIEDEDSFLQSLRAILKEGGVAVIKVPAHSFLYSDLDKQIGHFRRYSSKRLAATLKRNGFNVERIRSFNTIGFFGWLLICKLLRKSTSEVQGGCADFLFSITLPIERHFLSPIGLSIIAKAKKIS
jgi:2-polyprenyl-3-methyl-5-hydroxy-6-metoxy-1,4-benzoquinol methylase